VQPIQDNWTIYQGSTFKQIYQLIDELGLPFNLSGYTAKLQCRQTIQSIIVLFECSTENGGIEIFESLGLIHVDLTDTQTQALTFTAPAVFDLELYHDAITERMVFGNVTLSFEVTRP